MAGDTATIRVARATRDRLADQARLRGISVSALLAEVAREHELREIWRSEREASTADAHNPEVLGEAADWEATLPHGLD